MNIFTSPRFHFNWINILHFAPGTRSLVKEEDVLQGQWWQPGLWEPQEGRINPASVGREGSWRKRSLVGGSGRRRRLSRESRGRAFKERGTCELNHSDVNQHRPNGETVRNRTGQVGQLVEDLWAVLGARTCLGASLKGSWRIEIGQGCKELKAAMDQIYVAGEKNILRHCTGPHMTIQYLWLHRDKPRYHNTETVRMVQIIYKLILCQAHLPGSTSSWAHSFCPCLC